MERDFETILLQMSVEKFYYQSTFNEVTAKVKVSVFDSHCVVVKISIITSTQTFHCRYV